MSEFELIPAPNSRFLTRDPRRLEWASSTSLSWQDCLAIEERLAELHIRGFTPEQIEIARDFAIEQHQNTARSAPDILEDIIANMVFSVTIGYPRTKVPHDAYLILLLSGYKECQFEYIWSLCEGRYNPLEFLRAFLAFQLQFYFRRYGADELAMMCIDSRHMKPDRDINEKRKQARRKGGKLVPPFQRRG